MIVAKVDLADKLSDARDRISEETLDPATRGLPKFARLTRKEARVREDQYTALAELARTLMRRRRVKDERITENTLIRVAIDLLLTRREELHGATEEELRESVTSALPLSATPEQTDSGTYEQRGFRTQRGPDAVTSVPEKSDHLCLTGLATPSPDSAPQCTTSVSR